MSAAIHVVNQAHMDLAEHVLRTLHAVLLAAELPADAVLTVIVLVDDEVKAARTWVSGLPRPTVYGEIAGPAICEELDLFAATGQRPVLCLLYEDMAQKPVATIAAGASAHGFAPARGAA